jgi:chromosome segregation protein
MYISELNLHGFKSFAKKEKIKFGEGVTVIVGPNGCGKTNIVDAIRWVLGEQKYSVLRSGKMGDVIFNGADGLKPLSVCEAYLTVHNNRGKLPIEYTDIEIGRRVYRDGESEYFINKTPCRLKDIHDLFVDTGMGSDAYSVIELKMIEQILSETADDRKRMFEEAAGINKYKQQRQSALRKFDAVQRDLDRVNDIVQEVEQKAKSLSLQLKRFNRHEKLSEELFEAEVELAYVKVHDYESELIPLKKSVSDTQSLKNEKISDTSMLESELGGIKAIYKEQQDELRNKQLHLQDLEKARSEAQNNVLIWNEQYKSAELNINRLTIELTGNKEKTNAFSDQISAQEKNIADLDPKIKSQKQLYEKKNSEFSKVEEKYLSAQQRIKSLEASRWDAQEKIVGDRSNLDRAISSIDEKTTVMSHLNNKKKNLEKDQKDFSLDQKKIDSRTEKCESVVNGIKQQLNTNSKDLNESQAEHSHLKMNIHSQQSELQSLKSQLTFMNELIEQKQGYPEGAKTILSNKSSYDGLVGAVGELFQVEAKYESAFQSALGDWAKCIVVDDRQAAIKIHTSAKSNQLGNFSIIPLKELKKIKHSRRDVPKIDGVIGHAIDFCGISSSSIAIAELLIGNLLLVEDLSKIDISEGIKDWDIVDLKGSFYGSNFLLKYQDKTKETSIIGREKKAVKTQKEILSLEQKIEKNKKLFSDLEQSISSLESEKNSLSKNYELRYAELNDLKSIQIKNHFRQSQNLESIKELDDEIVQNNSDLDILKKKVDHYRPSIQKIDNLIKKLQKDIDLLSNDFSEIQSERDSFQRKTQEARIDLLNMENRLKSILYQKDSAIQSVSELEIRDKSIKNEIVELGELKKSLDIKIVNDENNLKSLVGELTKEKSVFDLKEQAVSDTFNSMESLQSKINQEKQLKENLFEQQKNNELRIVELDQKIGNIKERMMEKYNSKVPKDLVVDKDIVDLENDIDKIQKSIENIGPLNMAAQQEYEEEQGRLENLLEQRIDILKSEENLKETIAKIDVVAREKFESTFEKINNNFTKLFGMFFEGGTASLSLSGEDDPLEAQIIIHAQPPGKKNQNLRMLSAGEKSLTAIALLFAIYQYKPSPYCVLDEVDAPLDDVNIQKFKRVLNSFAKETQFIVVTHNKLTMEAADYLYGVTMEKKGVSKLVSVKFKGEA